MQKAAAPGGKVLHVAKIGAEQLLWARAGLTTHVGSAGDWTKAAAWARAADRHPQHRRGVRAGRR